MGPPHALSMHKFVIFDIDATLAENQWRVKLFDAFQNPENYDKYKSLSHKDPVILPNVIVCRYFLNDPQWITLFFTGRNENERAATLTWLRKNVHSGIQSLHLFMRPEHLDHTLIPDGVMKLQWARELTGDDLSKILCVFEDRNSVVKAWRDAGVYCIQPQLGAF